MNRRSSSLCGGGLATTVLVLAALAVPTSAAPDHRALPASVHVADVMTHLEAFDRIASENGGNRAIGTPGYEASGAYVEGVLRAAGYDPVRQPFTFHTQTLRSVSATVTGGAPVLHPVGITFTPGTDEDGVTADLVAPAEPLGCDAAAWHGVDVTGGIALVSRGTCGFLHKSQLAYAAGAVGLLVYNNAEDENAPVAGTLVEPHSDTVPSVGVPRAEGNALLAALDVGPVEVTMVIDEEITAVHSFNVIAETPGGRADNVVMVGAHLDSVETGPGVNDNGSGSAAILQTAVELADGPAPVNKVRFAWWGGEESGLRGSTAYVESLDQAQKDDIAAYLNFDMVASPNYVIAVYDADQSTFPAPVDVPAGSTALEHLMTDFFDASEQAWIDVPFDGRSDYWEFIRAGIPAGGLFTGAEALKSEDEAALFGGVAGAPYDPNYHLAGDDLGNVNQQALGITVPVIAHVTAALAGDTSSVNGVKAPTTTTLRLSRSHVVRGGSPARAVATVEGATEGTVRFRVGKRVVGTRALHHGVATLTLADVRSLGRHHVRASFVATPSRAGSHDSAWLRVTKARSNRSRARVVPGWTGLPWETFRSRAPSTRSTWSATPPSRPSPCASKALAATRSERSSTRPAGHP